MAEREADLYETHGDTVRCTVCPRTCTIPEGDVGFCGVRGNHDGQLVLESHGRPVSTSVDPIEKKPLFHFEPGSRVYSLATKGCNFGCDFCQNYRIAIEYEGVREQRQSPAEIVADGRSRDCDGYAFTYVEPTIFLEYALDIMAETDDDEYAVFVSNGYMTAETADLLGPDLDAINVDIKGDQAFYRDHCGVPDPAPIYDALERLAAHDVHIEVTNLILHEENDDEEQIRERMAWIRDTLGAETPVHFTQFHPDYQMTETPRTPIATLERLIEVAREEGLAHVYCGNVPGHEAESTFCPDCGHLLIEREGFAVQSVSLDPDNTCPNCGHEVAIVGEARERGRSGRLF